MALITWGSVAGVPVHYARNLNPSLRNPGRHITRWRSTPEFKQKLDAMFEELWSVCPLGRADVIVTAGAFVDRNVAGSGKKSAHASGRAFDVDGIVWHPTETRPGHELYAIDFASQPSFYWGVSGIFNRHLRHVLHAAYNRAHHDHYHVEDTRAPTFSAGSRSLVAHLQHALTHVHQRPVALDGSFGQKTEAATREVLERLDISGWITAGDVWRQFNLETAKVGMSVVAVPPTDDPDRADDPPAEVVGTPQGPHEELAPVRYAGRRLRLTAPRMHGTDVRRLQEVLLAAGFAPGAIDGFFGPITRAAVVAYQLDKALEPDGIVGPVTGSALGLAQALVDS